MSAIRIAIIGGGAAGLAAAVTAARQGARVTIIEHMDRVGKKILSTGNGRCNYTNAHMTPECYYSGRKEVVSTILKRYPTKRILSFFEEIGVVPWERDGYYYPASGQAAAVLDCLRAECQRLGVEIQCETEVAKIQPGTEKNKPVFHIETNRGRKEYDRVIVACGGQSAAHSGSDGSGYALATQLGHRIRRPFPALTGLKADPKRFKSLAGIRVRSRATLYVDGKAIRSDQGELQLTENGLSGIVIFQLSHPAVEACLNHKKTEVHLNFLPDMEAGQVFPCLKQRQALLGYKELQDWGTGLFHKKLWLQLIKEAGLSASMPASKLDNRMIGQLVQEITDFTVPIQGYLDFDRAQVTAGGVDLKEIDPQTMASKKWAGLYFAGEILDVDGICGGYNLHWAWATGMAAAQAACQDS